MSGAGAAAKVVDQASIHAQFSMLQAERDQLRCQVVSLDRNRRQEEQALMTLRQTYQRLGQELRVANDTLGGLNNKRQALENEYERLRQLHNFEKKELMGLTEEMEERYRIEQNDKQAFVTELDGVNAKMDRSIRAYEEFKARESITADAISALLKEPSMQKDTNLLPKVEEQLVELRSVEAKVMTFQEEHAEHCRQVTALRQEALNEAHEHGQALGEAELTELERGWESSWQQQEFSGFSMPYDNAEQRYDETSADPNGCHNLHETPIHSVNLASYDTNATMELFYGQNNSAHDGGYP